MRVKIRTLSILFVFLSAVSVSVIHAEEEKAYESIVRKKLFLIERRLSKVSEGFKNPLKTAVSPIDTDALLKDIESSVDEAKSKEATDNDKKQDPDKKEFGSVTAALGGGKLTGYSYSQTGLDLSEHAPDFSPKLLLKSTSVNLDKLGEDESMDNSFSASQNDFYGMENYDRFKDMFETEEKTDSYTMTGIGFKLDAGSHTMSLLSNTRPPEKKKKAFFGGGSEGPYPLNVTSILPGSERVYLDGSELASGGGYTFNYSKGEIIFSTPISRNNRVVVEYEVASGSTAPGKFTGFRIEKTAEKDESTKDAKGANPEKRENVNQENDSSPENSESGTVFPNHESRTTKPERFSYGVSYLKDRAVSFKPYGNGQVDQDYFDQTLMGVDGALMLGKGTKVGFEYARSEGDKQREIGRFASQTFTVADTKSPDLDPKGPYYLDETKLPVMEGSEEVRVNGQLLARDTDYTLDLQYGHLKLKKQDLNLTALDAIEIRYRYLTEADRINSGENVRTDSAYLMNVENAFGKLKHTFSATHFGKDFLALGGRASNQLRDEKQTLSYNPSEKWNFELGKTFSQSLDDRATEQKTTARGDSYKIGYKGGKLGFNLSNDNNRRYDSLAVHQTDDTRAKRDFSLDYKFNDAYSLSFKNTRNRAENLRQGNPSNQSDKDSTLALNTKPFKTLTADMTFTRGDTENESASQDRNDRKKSESYKIKYIPFKTLTVNFDLASNSFANALTDAPDAIATSATGAFATSTAQGNAARNEKWSVSWNPSQRFNFSTQKSTKRDRYVSGAANTTQTTHNIKTSMSKSLDLILMINQTRSNRPTQTQKTDLANYGVVYKTGLLPSMELRVARDTMTTDMESRYGAAPTVTSADSGGFKYSVSAEPFWKGKIFKIERKDKSTSNHTNDSFTSDRETGYTYEMVAPFLGESSLTFNYSTTDKTGVHPTEQESLSIGLSGKLTNLFDLSCSFKTADFTDVVSPSANTHDADMNVVVKGNKSF